MFGKFFICGLMLAFVLVNGCNEDANQIPTEQQVISQEELAPAEQELVPVERETVEEKRMVKLQTSMGDIVIELNPEKAPLAVKNFLEYVESGFYDGTIFHRVMSGFMIQAGGMNEQLQSKQTNPPIQNEASNGLKNDRGTIAMGQLPGNPDSATTHFFINHVDNDLLNYVQFSNPGYAVFGKVTEGMDVVDAIASVKTTTKGIHENVPVEPVIIESARVIDE